jgi:hypothetical protein
MKCKKVSAIIRTHKLGEVESRLKEIGVRGMTALRSACSAAWRLDSGVSVEALSSFPRSSCSAWKFVKRQPTLFLSWA